MPEQESSIGAIGPGQMGRNLVLNMADYGFSVSVMDLAIHSRA
jgi:6-phosphogluconate dehydrogenase